MPAQQSAIVATAHRVYNRLAYGLRELVSAGAIEGGQVFTWLATVGRRRMPPPGLTPLEDVVRLSPAVVRLLGQNPGPFTLQGTNTYIVGTGRDRVLIDAGEPNVRTYLEKLAALLDEQQCTLSAIVVTHWHYDHVGGVAGVLKKFCEGRTVPVYKLRRADGMPENYGGLTITYIQDGHELSIEGATLRLIQTPGHTSDHASVLLVEENALFSGDCVLGQGTAIFEDLSTYMASLRKLLASAPTRIYPGHGPVVEDAVAKLREYIEHRERREAEILAIIDKSTTLTNDGGGGVTPMQITYQVYPTVPISVRLAALGGVKLVLAKLVHEGRVLEQRGVYTSTPSSSSQSAAAATAGDEELQNAKAAAVNSKL